jgi:hypothetical protein
MTQTLKNKIQKFREGNFSAKEKSSFVKKAAVVALLASTPLIASNQNAAFTNFKNIMTTWLEGDLGYIIALFGFVGTLVVYAFTHKGSVLFIGAIISFLAGGMVGISQQFFNVGKTGFNS